MDPETKSQPKILVLEKIEEAQWNLLNIFGYFGNGSG
jgi:hypothetical protein